MESNSNRYIMACIDGSPCSGSVCDYANWMSNTLDLPLKFLHTIEHADEPPVTDLSGAIGLGASEDLLNELAEVEENRSRLLIKKGNLMLQAAKERSENANINNIELEQRHGTLTEALIEMEDNIEVLIVGIRGEAHTHGVGVGTQIETVVRTLHKPILVINGEFTPPKSFMLAYNGSAAAKKALEMVCTNPLFRQLECHLVQVVQQNDGDESVLRAAEYQLVAAGVKVTSAQPTGKIEEALANYQTENSIDLTVMGAFSHNRVRDFLLGSFTATMLEQTKQPLLLIR